MHRSDSFDLMKNNFNFGIEEIDARLGRIEVYATKWTADGIIDRQIIEMAYCRELADSKRNHEDGKDNREGFDLYSQFVNSPRRMANELLCPNVTSMVIQGDFRSEADFRYIEVLVKGCNLTDGSCISGTELDT